MSVLPQYGAPSPPPAPAAAAGLRNNIYIPSTMTSQGMGGAKHVPRPNTLASAISR